MHMQPDRLLELKCRRNKRKLESHVCAMDSANIHRRCQHRQGHGNTERHCKKLKHFISKPDTHIPLQLITKRYVEICVFEIHLACVLVFFKHRKNGSPKRIQRKTLQAQMSIQLTQICNETPLIRVTFGNHKPRNFKKHKRDLTRLKLSTNTLTNIPKHGFITCAVFG